MTNGSSIAGDGRGGRHVHLSLAIAPGINTITITGTDPAGNVSEVRLDVKRGNGKLTVKLIASDYQIQRSRSARARDPDRQRHRPRRQALAGADVTFTLSIPGIPTVTSTGRPTRTAARRSGRRSRRARTSARAAPRSWCRAASSARPRTSRSSRSSGSPPAEPPAAARRRHSGARQVMTAAPIAATIRPCRCGAVRTAGHPRPRRPAAGSAADPAPPARPVGTSVARSRPSSATAGSIASAGRSRGDEIRACWEAARTVAEIVTTPSAGRPRPRPSSSSSERPFEGSSSSRCVPRRAERADGPTDSVRRLAQAIRRAGPTVVAAAGRSALAGRRLRRPAMDRRRTRTSAARVSRAGACGTTRSVEGPRARRVASRA